MLKMVEQQTKWYSTCSQYLSMKTANLIKFQGKRDCNGRNICVDDYCQISRDSEMYCRKPICYEDYECGERGACRKGRCFLACSGDKDCSKWVCI